MRMAERHTIEAFLAQKPKNLGNSSTDGQVYLLFGNRIAWWEDKTLCMTLAGWETKTTFSRLNSICELAGHGRPWHKKDGKSYFSLSPVDPDGVIRILDIRDGD